MFGKVLSDREREKHSEPILERSLLAEHHTGFDDMTTAACAPDQDQSGDLSSKGCVQKHVLHTRNYINVDRISSFHFHIRVLYAVIICLTVVLVPSLIICYREISSLNEVLSRQLTVGDLVDFKFPTRKVANDDLQMPYISAEDELSLGGFWSGGEFTADSETKSRPKRQSSFQEGSGVVDDWLWMSSFARVPRSKEGMIIALQSYCREAQLYCAASGKPGPPGPFGPKGEIGEKGEKGNPTDPSGVAVSVANIEDLRGPPGHKGEQGADGLPGPIGPKGETGSPGVPGENSMKGYPGPRGPKGEPGTRGLLGFPGVKGDPGSVGATGPRGDTGPPGKEGSPGIDGAKGERGVMGSPGERGISGYPGVPGQPGHLGQQGMSGLPGLDGLPGFPGPKGEPGECQASCGDSERSRAYTAGTTPAPTFPPRVKECSIEIVGVPVFQRVSSRIGTWMKDSATNPSKIWVTHEKEGNSTYEYSTKDNFINDRGAKEISLSHYPYYGTGHVVYRGYVYYHWLNTSKIVRFDLTNSQVTTVRVIPDMVHEPLQRFLYQSQTMFVHFNVDQNGLWIIYGNEKTDKIIVAMLNAETLDVINSVKLDLQLGSKGGAFIVCGKLYTLKHHNRQRSFLDNEYDLWLGTVKPLRINFNNPYGETYMLSYDPSRNQILSWDGGRLLVLPLLLKSN